MSDTMTP